MKKKNIVSRTLSVHKEHEFLGKLEAVGLDDDLAQKVIESKENALAKCVIDLIRCGGSERVRPWREENGVIYFSVT